MSVKRKILLYYVTFLVTAMIIGGFYPYATSATIIQNILFLPIAILLWVILAKSHQQTKFFASKKMKVWLIYSTLVVVILTLGAFLNASSFNEVLINIFVLPVSIQLLIWVRNLFKKDSK